MKYVRLPDKNGQTQYLRFDLEQIPGFCGSRVPCRFGIASALRNDPWAWEPLPTAVNAKPAQLGVEVLKQVIFAAAGKGRTAGHVRFGMIYMADKKGGVADQCIFSKLTKDNLQPFSMTIGRLKYTVTPTLERFINYNHGAKHGVVHLILMFRRAVERKKPTTKRTKA